MIKATLKNILISVIALIIVLCIVLSKCNRKRSTQMVDLSESKKHEQREKELLDSLDFVRGILDLQKEKADAKEVRVLILEDSIDRLISKHKKTVKRIPEIFNNNDTGFVLAPNEYVNECEQCFGLLDTYKIENKQLRFERDSYDTLMRAQSAIQEKRITNLESEKDLFKRAFLFEQSKSGRTDVTRKVKLSAMGMLNDLFLPNGGGAGLIYEDKKSNEFGAHMLLTGRGNIYLVHIAKTISFRNKK